MGWTGTVGMSKAEAIAELVGEQKSGDRTWRTLEHTLRGNVLYAVQVVTDETGAEVDRFIMVALVRKSGDEVLTKTMTEESGPVEADCPLSYFDMVPDPGGYATAWREKCRAHAEMKKGRRGLMSGARCGDRVYLRPNVNVKGPGVVVYTGPRGRIHAEFDDGRVYRISARHVERIEKVGA